MMKPRAADDAFRAVADPTRRAVLDALSSGELSVNEICERFHVTQSAISQHLKVLRDAGLVKVRAQGRQRIYRLEARPLREVFDWAAHYEKFWNKKLDALGELLDREARRGARKKD
jgi:DNA-binding transcriptional ArsR family regulator